MKAEKMTNEDNTKKLIDAINEVLFKLSPQEKGEVLALQTDPKYHCGLAPNYILIGLQDFISLMMLADMGVQSDRPKRMDSVILERIRKIAMHYGIGWAGVMNKPEIEEFAYTPTVEVKRESPAIRYKEETGKDWFAKNDRERTSASTYYLGWCEKVIENLESQGLSAFDIGYVIKWAKIITDILKTKDADKVSAREAILAGVIIDAVEKLPKE